MNHARIAMAYLYRMRPADIEHIKQAVELSEFASLQLGTGSQANAFNAVKAAIDNALADFAAGDFENVETIIKGALKQ